MASEDLLPDPVLSIRDLRVVSGSNPEDRFSLNVPRLCVAQGALVAVTGPSGAGKSTLLECLALLRQADRVASFEVSGSSGTYDLTGPLVDNRLAFFAHLRSTDIGYVSQSGGVLPYLDARQNGLSCLHSSGRHKNTRLIARFDEIAQALGLQEHLLKRRDSLSGGQRKRVALLRGLAVPRRLLLLDEPTAGLDEALAHQVIDLVKEVCQVENTACISATHDTGIARNAGFEVLSIVQSGAGATLMPKPTKMVT